MAEGAFLPYVLQIHGYQIYVHLLLNLCAMFACLTMQLKPHSIPQPQAGA